MSQSVHVLPLCQGRFLLISRSILKSFWVNEPDELSCVMQRGWHGWSVSPEPLSCLSSLSISVPLRNSGNWIHQWVKKNCCVTPAYTGSSGNLGAIAGPMSSRIDQTHRTPFKMRNIMPYVSQEGWSRPPVDRLSLRVSGCRRWDDMCAERDSFPFKQSAMSVRSKRGPFAGVYTLTL